MNAFWLSAALMTVVTLVLIAAPLLKRPSRLVARRVDYDITVYKDQLAEIDRDFERGLLGEAEAEAAKIEIQRRMLKAADGSMADSADGKAGPAPSRSLAIAGLLAVVFAAGAFAIYAYKGSPDLPDRPYAERDIGAEIADREGRLERREVMQLVARLIETLKKNPDDIRGWLLLGRTYMTLDESRGALAAFRRAMELSGRRPDITADYAEAMVLAEDGKIQAAPKKLFAEILAADPFAPKARYYLGLAKAQAGDLKGALQDWIDLIALSEDDAPWMETLTGQVTGIAGELGIDPATVKPSGRALALSLTRGLGTSRAAPALPQSSMPAAPRGPSAEDVKAAQQMSADDRQKMIRTMVQRLADRLKDNPDDLAGWQRLARAYKVLGDAEKSKQAQARAEALQK
ncbi:MAG: c-type cytochrome biogenesis protein CcmI [Rhodospirillales bacterium]|nr:c-type cytochrome biogenesis protein CcmI [Rhodospirillales bacterium]